MKKKKKEWMVTVLLWILMILFGVNLVQKGMKLEKRIWVEMACHAQQQAIEVYLPGILGKDSGRTMRTWILEQMANQLPGFFSLGSSDDSFPKGDAHMDQRIIKENADFLVAKLQEENQEKTAVTIPQENLSNYDFIMSHYYTVDQTTSMSSEQLNAPELIQMDLRMQKKREKPQILIYHSHSQEEFADSVAGDPSTTVVGVGDRLTDILQDTYGYQVIHVTDSFDLIDGKLDRNLAYSKAQEKISQVLEENPSVEVVIDLHRDGVPDGKHMVTTINGKNTAKIMFFNGLCRTNNSGEISYLPNPYIRENLAFSLQMMLKAQECYSGFARTIYLRGYRYNLHLRPKSLLIECGAQTNTVEEEMNAMEPLADILNRVLTGI